MSATHPEVASGEDVLLPGETTQLVEVGLQEYTKFPYAGELEVTPDLDALQGTLEAFDNIWAASHTSEVQNAWSDMGYLPKDVRNEFKTILSAYTVLTYGHGVRKFGDNVWNPDFSFVPHSEDARDGRPWSEVEIPILAMELGIALEDVGNRDTPAPDTTGASSDPVLESLRELNQQITTEPERFLLPVDGETRLDSDIEVGRRLVRGGDEASPDPRLDGGAIAHRLLEIEDKLLGAIVNSLEVEPAE